MEKICIVKTAEGKCILTILCDLAINAVKQKTGYEVFVLGFAYSRTMPTDWGTVELNGLALQNLDSVRA